MSKIKVLSEKVANQIAAGEVIERPASVVKELVENAIDADATQITIEIKEAGQKYLRIMDNGFGMVPEDAELAVERFATSKLVNAADLFEIHTLGFRGEALPSIASVSKFEMITRSEEHIAGTKITIEGGIKKEVREIGAPVGTTIKVQDLFYNTPARLKFLKSDSTELAQISAVVSHLALGYPQIYFKLIIDGKESLNLPPVTEIRDRIIAILGKETAAELIPLPSRNIIAGYIAKPSLTRNNWSGFMSFVNNRFVTNRTITRAVFEGYHTLLPVQRYPVGVIFINLDPKLIDVNVHPTKREVRFVEEREVFGAVLETIRFALHQATLIPEIKTEIPSSNPPKADQIPNKIQTPSSKSQTKEPEPAVQTQFEVKPIVPEKAIPESRGEALLRPQIGRLNESPLPQPPQELPSEIRNHKSEIDSSGFPELEPLAQLDETYILCKSGEDLLIIDQHAAHERILYDRVYPKLRNQEPISQLLLFPETFELGIKESIMLQEYMAEIHRYGFEIEHFGGDTYTIRAVPEFISELDYRQLIIDILDTLDTIGKRLPTDEMIERMTTFLVCRSAVKAGDIQQAEEWKKLVYDLQHTTSPYTCPHGRPTVIRLSKAELEKRFKRT
ncbi:MAG: DNA mismatch repair endonuclease MutL [bacterium]